MMAEDEREMEKFEDVIEAEEKAEEEEGMAAKGEETIEEEETFKCPKCDGEIYASTVVYPSCGLNLDD